MNDDYTGAAFSGRILAAKRLTGFSPQLKILLLLHFMVLHVYQGNAIFYILV